VFSPGANALFGKKNQKWVLKCPKKHKLVKVKKNQYTCKSSKKKRGGKAKEGFAVCGFLQKYNVVKGGHDTCGKNGKNGKAKCKSSKDNVKYVVDGYSGKKKKKIGRDTCVQSGAKVSSYKRPKLKKVK